MAFACGDQKMIETCVCIYFNQIIDNLGSFLYHHPQNAHIAISFKAIENAAIIKSIVPRLEIYFSEQISVIVKENAIGKSNSHSSESMRKANFVPSLFTDQASSGLHLY